MPENMLTYRTMQVRQAPQTINLDDRSIEAVCATESKVRVFDPERYEAVDEVLMMSGCQMPESRQVPLLDNHQRYQGASSVLGSFRGMRIEGDMCVGRPTFSTVPEAENPWIKVREGHLTDFSVGYRSDESTWIPENTTTVVNGRSFMGPCKVTKKWTPREVSVVPIGADQFAKARAEHTPNSRGDIEMTDEKKPEGTQETAPAPVMVDQDRIRAEAAAAERTRVMDIQAMCARFDFSDLGAELVGNGSTVDSARAAVMDRLSKQQQVTQHRPPVMIQADERDKFRGAAEDSLLLRAGTEFSPKQAAAGAEELRGYSMRELARECLRIVGRPMGGNPLEMIGRALTTSDFPYIIANVAKKSLFLGWESASETWSQWCATGQVSDFKTHYSPRVSEASELEEVPEDTEYKYGKRTEAQESYQVATYGKIFAVSRQLIINDDLGAITRDNFGRGEAAARKVGDIAYAVLTANAAMGDAVALFDSATHANLATGGTLGAPGIATLGAAVLAMGTQKDLQGLRRLNIRPIFFLAPLALQGSAEAFFRSEKFSDSDTIATDSSLASSRVNIYSGNVLTRVYDGRLDDTSTTGWYLAASKGKTVTVFFLDGVQSPYLETKEGWNVDGVEYKVRIDAGAKALDYRGLYSNPGV